MTAAQRWTAGLASAVLASLIVYTVTRALEAPKREPRPLDRIPDPLAPGADVT
jgi:hypothetical protein